jgi:carbamoyltransferase
MVKIEKLPVSEQIYIGIATGPYDPAVAAVSGGRLVAYAEEERFIRDKHAVGRYPDRALDYCLTAVGSRIDEVASVAVGWDCEAYSDGRMSAFYDQMAGQQTVDPATRAWQQATLDRFSVAGMRRYHHQNWRRRYGDLPFPPITSSPHHFTHAFQAAMESPYEKAVVFTADGSGDQHTTVVWAKEGRHLRPLREIHMPHSLGWFYAAFTEYLGFEAYDGEYKVMGLAAYGEPDAGLTQLVRDILRPAADGVEFRLDPTFIHRGEHTWSGRFTDRLVEHLGNLPRRPDEDVTCWHMNLAHAVQRELEDAAGRLLHWAVRETGFRNVCVGGGVGQNVKMNARLMELPGVADVFAHPLCADGGAAAGAALIACFRQTGLAPPPLTSVALGPEEDAKAIRRALDNAHVPYEEPTDLNATVSRDLVAGKIVGWCQGRMEAGPRALGNRSILADPRSVHMRDRVNEAVKHREFWRPFGPAMLAAAADRYLERFTDSRFMTMAFPASEALRRDAPAVVHSDGSSRVQLVHPGDGSRLHELLTAFADVAGVPVLLNTSFNIRGEPIVCTTEDALRTFWSTGLEVLVLGDVIIRKQARTETTPA